MPGQVSQGMQVNNLGAVKDKSADMGLRLGSQTVPREKAIQVRRPDGSVEWFDPQAMEMIGTDPGLKLVQGPTPAEQLNAPIPGENAFEWVQRNMPEQYGAQYFGDEAVLANMQDKGSGGGIPQVAIEDEIDLFAEKLAKRMGIEKKGVRSLGGLQGAVNAYIAQNKAAGKPLYRMVDGKQIVPPVPGVNDVMYDLKIPEAQQKRLANALYQLQMADYRENDAAAKQRYKEGGRGRRPEAKVIGGVSNPKSGGDNLQIKKDVPFQQRVVKAGVEGEGAKPFVGLLEGDPKRITNDRQVYRGMSPVEVRQELEKRDRANYFKKLNAAKKKGKTYKAPKGQSYANKARIRAAQEGNVLARLRADRDAAGQPRPTSIETAQVGRAMPPRPRPQLAERPVYPKGERPINTSPNVVEAPQIDLPEGYGRDNSIMESLGRFASQAEDFRTNPKYQKQRRIGYGVGGGAAALATILGLSNMGREEEDERYYG